MLLKLERVNLLISILEKAYTLVIAHSVGVPTLTFPNVNGVTIASLELYRILRRRFLRRLDLSIGYIDLGLVR